MIIQVVIVILLDQSIHLVPVLVLAIAGLMFLVISVIIVPQDIIT